MCFYFVDVFYETMADKENLVNGIVERVVPGLEKVQLGRGAFLHVYVQPFERDGFNEDNWHDSFKIWMEPNHLVALVRWAKKGFDENQVLQLTTTIDCFVDLACLIGPNRLAVFTSEVLLDLGAQDSNDLFGVRFIAEREPLTAITEDNTTAMQDSLHATFQRFRSERVYESP